MIHHLAAAALLVTLAPATHAAPALPLGDAGLAETRTTETLARGVTLTHITRGSDPAPSDQINTTTRGPWQINVLTIDPAKAHGHLQATYGEDLARTETVTDLVRRSGALAGVNASFFTFTASQQFPGTPVGLGIYQGKLQSDPSTDPAEADMVIDSRRNKVALGKLTWTATVTNPHTHATLPISVVNEPPAVPAGCTDICDLPGQLAQITPEFAAQTPAGPGTEIVLDHNGHVLRATTGRGTTLTAGQTALQATGDQAAKLLGQATGTLRIHTTITDDTGHKVVPSPGTYAVNGRYRLTAGGQVVVPPGTGSFFDRNPRTIAGTTRTGAIVLATIDGRMTTSVGTTMNETAAVARSLGLTDALNLDGGGSTTMSVRGELTNKPSGSAQRPVGDAVVWTTH